MVYVFLQVMKFYFCVIAYTKYINSINQLNIIFIKYDKQGKNRYVEDSM